MRKITKATKDAPYPYNLIHDIHAQDMPLKKLAPDMDQSIGYVMNNMPEREARILQLRYKDGKTVKEIAEEYGVTAQRIRQIIQHGMRLLRHPSRYLYLWLGYKAVTEKEEQKRLRAQFQKEQIDNFLRPDRFTAPLSEIPDAHDRADAILSRCKLDMICDMDLSVRLCNILMRAGIEYIWELCFVQPHEILQLRGTSQKQVSEAEQCLGEYQLALDDGTLSADPQLWDYLNQKSQDLKQLIQETAKG